MGVARHHVAFHRAVLFDDQAVGPDLTEHLPVDTELAFGLQIACHGEPVPQMRVGNPASLRRGCVLMSARLGRADIIRRSSIQC